MKGHLFNSGDVEGAAFMFECPGCGQYHAVNVKPHGTPAVPVWQWNGSMEKPTFSPSLLVRDGYVDGKWTKSCHSFIRDGRIQFLGDSTHALAGQTVDMLEWVE